MIFARTAAAQFASSSRETRRRRALRPVVDHLEGRALMDGSNPLYSGPVVQTNDHNTPMMGPLLTTPDGKFVHDIVVVEVDLTKAPGVSQERLIGNIGSIDGGAKQPFAAVLAKDLRDTGVVHQAALDHLAEGLGVPVASLRVSLVQTVHVPSDPNAPFDGGWYGRADIDVTVKCVPTVVQVPGPTVYVPVPGPTVYIPGPTKIIVVRVIHTDPLWQKTHRMWVDGPSKSGRGDIYWSVGQPLPTVKNPGAPYGRPGIGAKALAAKHEVVAKPKAALPKPSRFRHAS